MTKLNLAAIAALVTLAACNDQAATPAPTDNAAAANAATATPAPIEMPPAIKSSKPYRCDDNSIVNVDLFDGDKQATIKPDGGTPVVVKSEEPGKPMAAEGGYGLEVMGDAVKVTMPGKGAQTCRV